MEKILYPFRDLLGGLYTASDETRMPPNCLQDGSQNLIYKKNVWRRKRGRAKYNATYMHATEEVRGLFKFATGASAESMLAVCNGSFYKTTGDGSMGSALTEPDSTAVSITNSYDVFGALYRNRLYLTWGDVSDHPVFYDGTNIINYEKEATGTADSGTTTTLVDDALNQAEDYWNGSRIKITDSTDGTVYWGWVTNFVAATDTVTFSPTCSFDVDDTDAYELGVAAQEERNGKYTLVFKERMFTAVGSTIYFTDPYNPDKWTPDSGVNIKYPGRDDGEDISGMVGLDNYLIVFKPHHIYAYYVVGDKDYWNCIEVKGTDSNKGAVWHRTIDAGFGGIIYMSWDGVYVLDRSLNVRCVSRNIEPTIKALMQSVSNPGGMSVIVKTDTSKVDFELGATQTKIDTATVSGTFRVDKTTEAVDQSYTSGKDIDHAFVTTAIAQSFTTSKAQICTKIEIYIKKIGSPGNLTVYLKSDDNNSPGDTLASATISVGDVGTSYDYEIANITDTNLANATKYWIYLSAMGDSSNNYRWGVDASSPTYANGNWWTDSGNDTDIDGLFKVYYQIYESSSEFISQIHNLGAVPTNWTTFNATETLNGCSIAWYFRADSDSGMGGSPAWHAVENGGIPDETLAQYTQYRAVPTPTNIATPVVDDVTIRAYTGSSVVAPCAKMWDKAYWLSVIDTGDTTNSCIYWLDEEAWLYENKERWAKLDNIYANYFAIFNDQLISGSVGGTGLGGFLYYEDTGNSDLGNNFTSTLITKKDDFQTMNPVYANRKKVYLKIDAKYTSNVASSIYYKVDDGSWSSALSLSPKPDTGVEREHMSGLQTGRYLTLKWEHTVADNIYEIHGADIETIIKPYI